MSAGAFSLRRKARLGLFSGAGVAVVLAILALLNALSQRFFWRLDLTRGNRYSLSESSRRLVRGLEDPVTLKVFMSAGLPEPYATYGRYVKDLLEEYKTYGGGKVKVAYLNPDSSEKAKSEAISSGAAAARFNQVSRDQFQAREGFLGAALFYQDKQESIPFISDTDGLEYEVSSRIKRMTLKKKPVLGVTADHGERLVSQLKQGPMAPLFDRFDLEEVRLSTGMSHAPDLLFVAGPSRQFAEEEVAALDGLLKKKVPVALFLNRRVVNLQNFSSIAQITGLEGLLAHYGVDMSRDIVLDAQSQRISFQSNMGAYTLQNLVDYKAMPVSTEFHKTHPVVRGLDAVGFPFAQTVSFSTAADKGLKFTPLAESSRYSWVVPNLPRFNPFEIDPPKPTDVMGPFTLAAVVEGSAPSYSNPQERVEDLKLLVAGSGLMIDGSLPTPRGNAGFLLGAAEWMVQDKNMLSIPLKGAAFHPIRRVSDAGRRVVKYGGFFFLPVLLTLAGFLHWKNREGLRRRMEKEYGAVP